VDRLPAEFRTVYSAEIAAGAKPTGLMFPDASLQETGWLRQEDWKEANKIAGSDRYQ
jgi:hypothetical protein